MITQDQSAIRRVLNILFFLIRGMPA
jgi:hypothetical protein